MEPSATLDSAALRLVSFAASWDSSEQVSFFYYSFHCILLLLKGVTAISDAFFGLGTGQVLLSDLGCRGNETNLLECPFPVGVGANNCAHQADASVICEARNSKNILVLDCLPSVYSDSNTSSLTFQPSPLESLHMLYPILSSM